MNSRNGITDPSCIRCETKILREIQPVQQMYSHINDLVPPDRTVKPFLDVARRLDTEDITLPGSSRNRL